MVIYCLIIAKQRTCLALQDTDYRMQQRTLLCYDVSCVHGMADLLLDFVDLDSSVQTA